MATIQLRVLAPPAPESEPAICESVSPRLTTRVAPACALGAAAARERAGAAACGEGSAGAADSAPAAVLAEGVAGAAGVRLIDPSRAPVPTSGAATGA